MHMATYNSVLVQSNGVTPRKEAKAHTAIRPGMLIKRNSDGEIQRHSTAGGKAAKLFAVEDVLQGKGIDDWYAANQRTFFIVAQRGDEVWALATHDVTLAVGDYVESAGDGCLRKYTKAVTEHDSSEADIPDSASIVGTVLQAVATEDSSSDTLVANDYGGTRVLIEVI
jgi:hypothetical protein